MIISCTCRHEYQDKKYGKGKRVCNPTRKQDGTIYRCTVCKVEHTRSKRKGGNESI